MIHGTIAGFKHGQMRHIMILTKFKMVKWIEEMDLKIIYICLLYKSLLSKAITKDKFLVSFSL